MQPGEQLLRLPQLGAHVTCTPEPQGLGGIVLHNLDAGRHLIVGDLGGLDVADQRQHRSDARGMFGQLVAKAANRLKFTTGAELFLNVI
jgi:hypothetical protein